MMKKICILLMISLLLTGCGQAATKTTEPEATTEASGDIVTTQEELDTALKLSSHVILGGDIQLNSYVVLSHTVLSGNGHQLSAPTYNKEDPNTHASIYLVSGNVENISLIGGNRSMSTDPNHRILGDIRLANVVSNAHSALYVGHGDNEHNLDAVNCEFYGQTVFSRIAKAYFANCTFGYNSEGTQGRVWAYRDARFVNCRFEGMPDAKFKIIIPKEEIGRTILLENCYVGDTPLTQDNLHELLNVDNQGSSTIRVVSDGV